MIISLKKAVFTALVVGGAVSVAGPPAHAWNPPDGPASDQTTPPTTPITLLPKAHGYIIQNGITILNNDGYWLAAQTMRQWQQELLNGVRYADVYQGSQCVNLDACFIWCTTLDSFKCWPWAADNHYYNPDTGQGLQAGYLADAAEWTSYVEDALGAGLVGLSVDVEPSLQSVYPSALDWIQTEFANALSAYRGGSPTSIGGRTGTQLAMFYLGWASHFMQDQNVVHHTYDEVLKHHAEYENWADADTSHTPPLWNRAFGAPPDPTGLTGIYSVSPSFCTPASSPHCLALNANAIAHNEQTMFNIDDEYTNAPDDSVGGPIATAAVRAAIPIAERTQAGFYYAFLSSVGQPPVQMPAVLRAVNGS
jgi:hypothetical protein